MQYSEYALAGCRRAADKSAKSSSVGSTSERPNLPRSPAFLSPARQVCIPSNRSIHSPGAAHSQSVPELFPSDPRLRQSRRPDDDDGCEQRRRVCKTPADRSSRCEVKGSASDQYNLLLLTPSPVSLPYQSFRAYSGKDPPQVGTGAGQHRVLRSLVSLASRNHRSAEAITAALRTEASYHPFLCILTIEHAGCSSCCSLASSPSQVSRVQPTVARPIELKHP